MSSEGPARSAATASESPGAKYLHDLGGAKMRDDSLRTAAGVANRQFLFELLESLQLLVDAGGDVAVGEPGFQAGKCGGADGGAGVLVQDGKHALDRHGLAVGAGGAEGFADVGHREQARVE